MSATNSVNPNPAYDKMLAARDASKLTAVDYIKNMFGDSFIELHGDRRFADDKAIVAGLGMLYDTPVTVIGIEKGRNTKERMERNFGQAHPEGYRKALRLMKQAEKFHRPVLCLVDTSGAYPGIGAEERGQGQAIAENLMEMMTLKTPVLTILIGEGGSGGALALAVADEVWMLENSVYSVISPEGCASILWKDSAKAPQAAEALKMTAQDLFGFGVIERIIRQPKAEDAAMFESLKLLVLRTFEKNLALTDEELLERRYARFRKIGARQDQQSE
ncbi:acetyl-CoA carboxylase carboxyltransferase subunit alpha [Lachnoclostridium sp. MSJ-17]|uniref:acetyl-CoA carboxylase carboxyltransferase subunit alpha n=1 Tax=Lachnoclostridium sp. MSJ-17 TaxID=2841516 RepID=UPI001C100F45|nr:acetyl-CoA carboxylase carboxyltransferase subunit alpha [Lachnoclostridium sp. MSJ-17]MBU5462144.1 acetyl-CoA carboxylase carboxyltransferase subunit alpha [Lachnoclostridium sp. MSJ-17]